MATSGQFDGSGGYQGRTLQFAWTRTGYDLQGNYSDIYWEVRVVGGSSSYYYHYHEHAYINGQQIHGVDARTQRYKGTVASGIWRFYHDGNGNCSFNVRLYGAVYTSNYNIDTTVTFTLDNLPRQANITNLPGSFTDEDTFWFDYTNPANWNLSCWIEIGPFPGDHLCERTLSGTSGRYTWSLTDAERNQIRSKLANSNNGTVRIGLYSNNETWASYFDRSINIINANPYFNTDPTYEVTNYQQYVDNQTIIRGYGNVTVTLPLATALKQATIKNYKVTIGNEVQSSANRGDFNFTKVSDTVIKCYVEDSRGNVTEKLINMDYIDYADPYITDLVIERADGGIGSEVNLSFTVHATGDLGNAENGLSALYYYKEQGATTWLSGGNLKIDWTDNTYNEWVVNESVKGNLGALGFDISKIYDIRIQITDFITTITKDAILGSGIPTVAIHRNGFALMGFYNEDEGGLFQIDSKQQPIYQKTESIERTSNYIEYEEDEEGKQYIKPNSIKSQLYMVSGTHIVTFNNSNGTLLHTWEEIQSMFNEEFGFTPADRTLLGVTVMNGDTNTTQLHIDGTCWYPGDSSRGSGDVHVLTDSNHNGNVRINYAYFYKH